MSTPMPNLLSIRSYSTKSTNHSHGYYQLVLPLRGGIVIEVGQFSGKVVAGECVVVRKHEAHLFNAHPDALFVVADMDKLPENIELYGSSVFAISKSLSCYLTFVEEQLQHQLNSDLEYAMFSTFYLLLAEQELLPRLDNRIAKAVHHIQQNIQETLTVNQLAKIACLSSTQFKLLFKKQLGFTVHDYVTKLRMEKAQALLRHTDFSVQQVGEMVGYPESSKFSRKFSQYYGLSPLLSKK
ncbi:helix-turn-helix domain-containing protein [Klebsiella pneumoniae]|nr:helix-turn-helix domain-containing protein [Klebsiella pneumoniae]EIV5989674.1 helix-turn-helix domain-containing protein [Klebsiella pneumoniae]EKX7979074.1 helix-turn-helix domain-containing protein [Klebsiella pneumoniae]